MPNRLHGKVAVVTGGSAGVGRATVRELAQRGAMVGVLARGRDGLDATVKEVEAMGGRALAVPADVADAEAVEAAAARIEAELGPIEVWINNAMTSVFSPFQEMTADEMRRVSDVTFMGQVHGTQAALRRMVPRDRGVIVSVGSALAYRSIPLQSAYCASKAATRAFVDSVRTELMHDGSRVKIVSVHLPALNTPQFEWVRSRLPNHPQPVPPIFQPEVAARGIVHAAENPGREMWLGLSTVATILGERVIPGLLDRYLARTGYSSQQTKEPVEDGRADNLYEPVGGDHGAHGAFDRRARTESIGLLLSMNRRLVSAGLVAAGAVAGRMLRRAS